MSGASTFDLSVALRAMGIRSQLALPSMATGVIVPVMILGDFSRNIAPEVIESRGLTQGQPMTSPAFSWSGAYLHSRSPGGLVVESVVFGDNEAHTWFRTSERPWAGGDFQTVFPIGGGAVESRWNRLEQEPDPPPNISALADGSTWGFATVGGMSPQTQLLERWWIPAGWYLGFFHTSGFFEMAQIRFREIPEMQGAP